jgi:hypothetical protein
MNTGQEPLANSVFPPPPSAENVALQDRADLPTDKANNNQNQFANNAPVIPASAYHVPPARFAPKAHAYRQDDFLDLPPETSPLPDRCQFMFSDGRQCTMARSDIHPSLCTYHSDREDQLFGDPAGSFVTRKLDLPELYSACRDLTTAAGVSRALAQVFRLLAQHRISRQEAATFGHLAQLLLRTISLMRSESSLPVNMALPSEDPERGTSPRSAPEQKLLRPGRAVLSAVDRVEPPPGSFVMKSNPQQDASSIFRRPTAPVVSEERFVLSGSTRGGSLRPQDQDLQKASSQVTQNEHLQNLRT